MVVLLGSLEVVVDFGGDVGVEVDVELEVVEETGALVDVGGVVIDVVGGVVVVVGDEVVVAKAVGLGAARGASGGIGGW